MAATLVTLWRQWGREFRVDAALLREQLAYAVHFACRRRHRSLLINYHQYVVGLVRSPRRRCDLRRRLQADPAVRPDHRIDGERPDGPDGGRAARP